MSTESRVNPEQAPDTKTNKYNKKQWGLKERKGVNKVESRWAYQ